MSDIDEIVTRELEREAAAAGGAPPQSALAPMPEPELAPDPEEQDDGFEAIVARERAREQATDLNINRAMKVEPDQRRSAMSLSEEFNLPLYLIESEREKFEQQYKEKQARQAAARLPALAEELQEPNTAPLVLAEAPYLLDLDESLQPKEIDPPLGEQFGVSLGRGALNTRYDYLGWKIGMKRASIEEREEHRALRAEIKRQSPFKDRPGPLDDIVRVTGTMLPYMGDVAVAGGEGAGVGLVGGAGAGAALGSLGGGVGAVPGAIAGAREGASTGAKAAVLYRLSQLEGGAIYNQLLDISDEIRAETGQEVPEEAIQGLMAAGGITNAMLEGFALGKFAKMFPGGKLLMAKLARTEMKAALTSLARRSTLARVGEKMALGAAAIGTNAIQEGLQGLAPRVAANMLTQTYLNPSVPLTAGLVQGFTEDTIQGLYGGVGIATLGGGASVGTEAVRRTFESRQRLADLDHHVEKADATKMATENPELFRRIVARTTDNRDGDRSVFVAPDMLEAALGETIADLPGLSAQVAEARVTRGDVVIRMEDYLTDLREYHQALRPHVRVGLAGASQQEMEYSEQLEAELAKAEKGREKLTPREQSSERIYDYMFEAATRDLKMSIPEAKAHAANFQAHMTQLAAEVNEDPWQFFEPIAKRLRLEGPAARADVTKPLLDQQLSRIDVERNLETIQNPAGVARQLRFPSYPVLELLKSHGGVNPNSPLGGDLKSMGVTAQSHPGLFQDDGLEALDNLDIENEPVLVGNLRIPDGEWYIAPNDLLDAIERELRGQPLRSEEQLQAIEAVEGPARELERHLLELGIDPRTATVEQALELLQRIGVHQPEVGEVNVEDNAQGETFLQPGTDAFARWFGDSKVVDENGQPLVVYHGTGADIVEFDLDHPDRRDSGWLGRGVYGTSGTDTADAYALMKAPHGGGRIMPLYMRIVNPYYATLAEKQRLSMVSHSQGREAGLAAAEEFTRELIARGHDGVILVYEAKDVGERLAGERELVAFTPEQVKSATGNRGTYDPNSANILEQDSREKLEVMAGLKGVLPLLLPAERARLRLDTAQAIADIFGELPGGDDTRKIADASEAASVAFAGRVARGWYTRSARALARMFGADDLPRFVGLLAALSPQRLVENNLEGALKVWAAWNDAGRPQDRESITRIIYANDRDGFDGVLNGAFNALTHPDPLHAQLTKKGLKVDSFYQNLMGAAERVTLDAHMASYFGLGLKMNRVSDYLAASAVVRKAAAILTQRTGEVWTPAEVQETIWTWVLVAKKQRKATGKRVVEQARENGISDEAMLASPDFDVLLAGTKFQTLMKELGLERELAALSRPEPGSGKRGAPRRTLEQPDPGIAGDAYAKHLQRAAERIDAAVDAGVDEDTDADPPAVRVGRTLYQPAFHGTGSVFERFLAQFIGTGEGTANQGWGFYFTSAESAMRFYAKQEGRKRATLSWTDNELAAPQIPDEVVRVLDDAIDVTTPIFVNGQTTAPTPGVAFLGTLKIKRQLAREQLARGEIQHAALDAIDDAILAVQSGRVTVDGTGNVAGVGLEVEIPAEDQLLDWRKPIAEQSDAVKAALAQIKVYKIRAFEQRGVTAVEVPMDSDAYDTLEDAQQALDMLSANLRPGRVLELHEKTVEPDDVITTGEELYEQLADAYGGGAREASLLLLSVGIKGHLYESGHGNENYVIYDPDSVKILRRLFQELDPEGELALMGNALAAAHQRGDRAEVEALRTAMKGRYRTLAAGSRGSLTFDADFQEIVLRMSQSRDASTFIHESGHLFLELMLRTAERTDASERLKNNAQAALDWLGAPDRMSITREQHETFARSYEAYLWEGKAPSLALVDTFARFTTFLLRVYRSLTELRVNLDDDIRSVFDRMVASDEAIAEARRVQGFMPAFNEAGESSGMTPEEYASYQVNAQRTYEHHRRKLMRETLDDLEQRKKQEYLEEKKRITQQVILDVNSRPVFRARGWLQTGTVPDGVAAPSIPHKRLDRVALVALKGMGILKVFPSGKYSIWQKEDGYAPETIARVFGFDSADHMLNAFATTSSRQEVIALEVEDRLARRFGDVFRDGRLPAMALEASMTNEQGEFLVAELKALQRNVLTEAERELGQELPLRTIKRSARRQIGETRVRDLRPDRYRSQEQKCALRAAEAIRARDWPTAHAEKMAEVLNHYLAIEAEKAKIRAEKDRRYLRTMSLAPARMRMGKAGHDYLQQIDALLERFKFGPLTKAASIERENLEAWIRKQELAGESVPIDPRIRSEAFRVDWKGMTVEQLSALSDAVHSIEHLAQKKNQLILRKQKRDFAETITTATVSIEQNTVRDVRHLDTADSPIVDGMMKFGRNVHGFHTKLEALFKRLDGGKLGFMWELCFKPFADAEAEEQAWMGELSTKLQTIFAKLREAGGRRPKLFIPELGRSLSFEKRLVIALNQGNEGNKAALLEGKLDGVEWDQQQIDAVLGTLEESDWDAVREIAALVASLKDRAFDLQERLSGVRPESVEAADVVTKFGVYPGWYWPLRADTGRSLIAHTRAEAEDTASMFEGNAFAPMTRTGHLNTRVGFGGQPVLLSLSVLSEHLYNVVHDVTHREALLQVDKVTQNKEVASAIVAAVGREMYLQIRPWLQGIAGERVDAQRTFIDPVLGWLRTGISVSYMGFKVSVMLSQSLGILQAMGPEGVGAVRFTKEMATFLRHPMKARQRVELAMSLSPALRARLNNFDRDARDAIKRGAFATSRFGELHADYVQFAMHAIGLADMTITVPTWFAAYGRALEEHGDSKAGVERAIAEADSVVRITMGAGGAKDLAAVQRGGELWRAMTGFYSAISAVYNQWGLQVAAIRDGRVSLAEVANAAMFLWILPAMIQPLLARQSPDDDDEWFEWYFTEIALYPANLVIGARDAAGYIKRKIRGEYADLSLPAIDSLELVVDATYDPLEALVEKGELSRKNMRDMANAVGVLAHLTSRQAVISFEALYDLSANQSRGKVEGLGDLFLTRPPERRARPMSYRPPARKTPPLEAAAPKSTRRQVLRDSEGLIRELVGAGKRTQVVRNASGQIEELVEVNDA